MRKWIAGLGVIAGLSIIGAWLWQSGRLSSFLDNSHGAIPACEKNLLAELRSPSTYRRISATYTSQSPLSFEEYKGYVIGQYCPEGGDLEAVWTPCASVNQFSLRYSVYNAAWQKGMRNPTKAALRKIEIEVLKKNFSVLNARPLELQQTAYVEIIYDAANAYGTPVRSSKICRFGPMLDGKYSRGDLFDPIVPRN